MAEQDPEYIQDVCKSAEMDRQTLGDLVCEEGVTEFAALRVTESSPAALSVTISSGGAFIDNDQDTADGEGGTYHVYNAGDVVLNISANNSGSTRTDSVWARVCDSQYAAVTSDFDLVVVEGNTVAPADGCTYYKLATVTVPDAAVAINGNPDDFGASDGQITDDRSALIMCGLSNPVPPPLPTLQRQVLVSDVNTSTPADQPTVTVPSVPYDQIVQVLAQVIVTMDSAERARVDLKKDGVVVSSVRTPQAPASGSTEGMFLHWAEVLPANTSAGYNMTFVPANGTVTFEANFDALPAGTATHMSVSTAPVPA